MLNRRVLADLACWEPQSFKALTDVAQERARQDGLNVIKAESIKPFRVITRGMRK